MNIAFISNSAKGEYTGRLMWALTLNAMGHNVLFVLPVEEEAYIKKIESQGIRVERWRLRRGRKYLTNKILSIFELIKVFNQYDLDIIHSFGHEANVLTSISNIFSGRKIVVNHITGIGSELTENISFFGIIILVLYRILTPFVSLFLFENEEDQELFTFIRDDKKAILPASGVDVNYFNPNNVDIERINNLKKELGLFEHTTIVTFVGRLLIHKGVKELIQSWEEISKLRDDVCLLIIGERDKNNPSCIDNDDIKRLKNLNSVKLLGRRNDVRDLLYITDIFVNPSYREGLPRTNIEAMAMSTPIITTDTPGCKNTVRDGIDGILVPFKDVESLTEAILTLIENKKLRDFMAVNARVRAENEFSLDKIIDRILYLYKSLIIAKILNKNGKYKVQH